MSPRPDEDEAPRGQDADRIAAVPPVMSPADAVDPGRALPTDPADEPPPGPVKPGQVLLGQYLVKRKLGEGGMGSVWLVEDQVLKTDRALKLIKSSFANLPEARARFQREAQVMARVKHDHAVVVHTAQLVGNTAAIVMEYISGDSIDHLLKTGRPMPLDWVGRVLAQLCACLQVAHDEAIVHRDLKPSNLMLVAGRPAGEVYLKVLDFGLAKFLSSEKNDAITLSRGALGTAAYLSPEQALSKEVDTRSDIYSVGVILYEFLTGHRPFQGPLYQVLTDHVNTPPPPFQKKAPGCRVPPEVEQVVMRCLEKDPDRRPASVRALAEAFRKATGQPVQPRPEPMPGPRFWAAALVAGFVLVVVLGVLSRVPRFRSLIGIPVSGTVRLQFDAPIDGMEVKLDESKVSDGGPFTLSSGSHRVVVAQGDFTAADELFSVSAGVDATVRIGLRRRAVVQFRPQPATVSVDGTNQVLDKEGGLTLDFAGPRPLDLRVKAEGYESFSGGLTYEEAARRGFEIRLEPDKSRLAQLGRSILQQYCHRCHGVEFQTPGLDVLDRGALVSLHGPGGVPYLVPGKPSESAIWLQIEGGKMPPKTARQPTRAEKDALKMWIEADAPPAIGPRRPFQSEEKVLTALRDHLRDLVVGNRRFQRYFTLTHLYNNPAVRDDELQLYRAALSKAINSLSRQPGIVVPQPVDPEGTVYRIDLREVGSVWDEFWPELLRQYPYGLRHDRGTGTDRSLRALSREVYDLSLTEQPYVRADWFVARATRPPLYHTLLALPDNAGDLERGLGVDFVGDFKNNRLARAGQTTSGVSSQNRLLERHDAAEDSYYWRSYDFQGAGAETDLLRFPLGPDFEGNPFAGQAFKHATSAIIFLLPNGLQGYMLVNGEGNRINVAPGDVLSDPQATSGTSQVVNGLSCMACHRLGVIRVEDEVHAGNNLPDEPRRKVEQLYPPQSQMDLLVLRDRTRFYASLLSVVGPFLQSGDQKDPSVVDLPEPIEFVARRFRSDLRIADIACELGVEDVDGLREQIRVAPELRRLGLEPLLAGSAIKRQMWESSNGGMTLFQRIASGLRLGMPAHEP